MVGAPLHHGGLEEGGGSSAKLTFLSNMWTLVVLALGTASQPHSPIQMSHICGIRAHLEPLLIHAKSSPSLSNAKGVCLSGFSAYLFLFHFAFCFKGSRYFCVLVFVPFLFLFCPVLGIEFMALCMLMGKYHIPTFSFLFSFFFHFINELDA